MVLVVFWPVRRVKLMFRALAVRQSRLYGSLVFTKDVY